MKKIFFILFAICLSINFIGCSSDDHELTQEQREQKLAEIATLEKERTQISTDIDKNISSCMKQQSELEWTLEEYGECLKENVVPLQNKHKELGDKIKKIKQELGIE